MSNLSVISWQEQVTFLLDDDGVHFVVYQMIGWILLAHWKKSL
jgi:hypothetical protein